ncbi:hypothetical protein OZD70_02850 [Wolbachia endosymbiont of Drosophila tsacasi]|nr:hypothetical protein [Wolbachia endosymbiont of Drosophila tsacasi]
MFIAKRAQERCHSSVKHWNDIIGALPTCGPNYNVRTVVGNRR